MPVSVIFVISLNGKHPGVGKLHHLTSQHPNFLKVLTVVIRLDHNRSKHSGERGVAVDTVLPGESGGA